MNNNEADKLNTNHESLLKYSGGTSYSNRSGVVSDSNEVSEPNPNDQPPVVYESRRARRVAETTNIPVITPDQVKQGNNATPAPWQNPYTPVQNARPQQPISQMPGMLVAPQQKEKPVKEYWGGIAILTSGVMFLGAQIVMGFAIVIFAFLNPDIINKILQGGDGTAAVGDVLASMPLLIILSQLMMYAAWLGCMWWVTKFRSGVQRGKKFLQAFKDNFRLNGFKAIDIAWGAGVAIVMLGLQYLVLNVLLPMMLSPEDMAKAGNTQLFQSLDGIWFYVIAFGLGGLLGPICEELFFRGFLMRGFSNHFSYKNSGRNMDILEDELAEQDLGLKSMVTAYRGFTHQHRYVLAAIVSSILFGLIHFQFTPGFVPWITVIFTGILGFAFAMVTLKVGRLYPAIIGHVLYNSSLFAYMVIMGM